MFQVSIASRDEACTDKHMSVRCPGQVVSFIVKLGSSSVRALRNSVPERVRFLNREGVERILPSQGYQARRPAEKHAC